MTRRIYKILLILGIVLILIAIPVFSLSYNPPENLEVDFLDVGQGDAILIKTPYGQNILIDGGPDGSVIEKLAENLPFWDRNIDLMILTHPHDDHVGGLVDVLKRYKVEQILYTGVVHDSPTYLAWLELVRDKKIKLVIVDRPQAVKFGEDCYLEIIYPRKNLLGREVDNLNNSSLAARLVYGQTKFLLLGDLEKEGEDELLASGANIDAEVLKVAHHGSDTSTGQEFLEKLSHDFAVIQVGADNDFGHPSLRILRRLEKFGAKIYRNDLDGTIRFLSDGNTAEYRP